MLATELEQTHYAMLNEKRNSEMTPLPTVLDVEPMILKSGKVHTFSRTFLSATVPSAQGIEQGYGLAFSLADLPNYTEFTSLFDQYRIVQVVATFNQRNITILAPNVVYTAIDYDDNTALTGTAIQQYDTCLVINSARFRRVLRPRLAVAAYGGTAFTSYANMNAGQWIDANSPSVQYYGLKITLPPLASGSSPVPLYDITLQYIVQCRSVR